MEKKTPLYDCHVALGGKIVPFAGYMLPVQYPTGVIAEHRAVRTACGLFDVSHMGEVLFQGPDALNNLQTLLCNDMSGMQDGRVRYSPMCNDRGGVVDDLIVYKVNDQCYYVVVNAANKDKDVAWMQAHLTGDVKFSDLSDDIAQIALQGPKAEDVLRRLTKPESIPAKYYSFVREGMVGETPCLISRTGYTGEKGFELYCTPAEAPALWGLLLDVGKTEGLIPCGLGARDTLRLEAGMPLYGHEMNDDITPLETGLGRYAKLDKGDFIGRQAILDKGEPTITRVGLAVTDRGIAREHCAVYADGRQIGVTTSGTFCPFVEKALAMALIEKAYEAEGTALEIDVRGRRLKAEVVPLPFYKHG